MASQFDESNDDFDLDYGVALPHIDGVDPTSPLVRPGLVESAIPVPPQARESAPKLLDGVAGAEVCHPALYRTNHAVAGISSTASVIAALAIGLLALLALSQLAC